MSQNIIYNILEGILSILDCGLQDVAGRVRVNFKDKQSLRVLTQTLLKHDFNLDIDIPPNNLVPALPLRLNYILWIEDLLKHSDIEDLSTVHGIDIGITAIISTNI